MDRFKAFLNELADFWVTMIIVAWIVLFTLGAQIDTSPHFAVLQTPASLIDWLGAFSVILPCWTLSNVGFLCLIASWAGNLGAHESSSYSKTITRGFLIYFLVLSGLVVSHQITQGAGLGAATQDSYVWLAGISSATCFAVAYQPQPFDKMINKFSDRASESIGVFNRRADD